MIIRDAVPGDAEAIARVHVEAWRTAYAGIIPDDYLAGLSFEERLSNWKTNLASDRTDEFYLVTDDEREGVVGFAAGGKEREDDRMYTGELYALYLRDGFRRRGLGRRLVALSAGRLLAMRHASMLVWVLSANPACAFYEALDGRLLRVKNITLGGRELLESAYGWKDLKTLAGSGG